MDFEVQANPYTRTQRIKVAGIRACETCGLFRLSGMLFSSQLHILCYHGFAIGDECQFRPKLFISPQTFEERINQIVAMGFVALPLGEAFQRLQAGTLPRKALVITIDDGFKSTLTLAAPILRKFGIPATVYVTTYYMEKQVPVFRLAMQYIFWKRGASGSFVELRPVLARLVPDCAVSRTWDDLVWKIIGHGEALDSEAERQSLLESVAEVLGLAMEGLHRNELVSLLSPDDVRELALQGFDIQLHTHRHRFPAHDEGIARREIQENRARLETLTGSAARHFCYPSGQFHRRQWPWLEELGISTATTCVPGINSKNSARYGLTRFLDSESITLEEFRGELAGLNEILRRLRRVSKAWVYPE